MRCHLGILDLGLTLDGPGPLVEPIAYAYRRFALDEPATGSLTIRMPGDAPLFVDIDGRRVELIQGIDPCTQLYQVFLDVVMDRLGSHALLHGAALLSPASGGVLLLAAPSGHGKSSLALELVRRGFGFLGDDYAPLDLENRHVHPYPRAVGLTTDAARHMATELVGRPGSELMGKRLVDVGELLGEDRLVRDPAPLRHIVLLSASLEGALHARTIIRLAARAAVAPEIDAVFAATEGVEIVAREQRDQACYWRLRVNPESGAPTGALAHVLESDRVLFVEKEEERRPDFSAAPAAQPVSRREAAELLGRELLNRRSGGRLLSRYEGSVAALFVDLAGALRDASCFRVRVGGRTATADLICDLARTVEARDARQ